jgi:hypothetical protein
MEKEEIPDWDTELPPEAQCIERQLGILLATTLNPSFLRTTYRSAREASEILEQAVFGNLFPICSQKGAGTVR